MMNNVYTPCVTAAAGTELASVNSLNTVIIFFNKRGLQRCCCHFLTLELLSGHAVAHCPIFPTAALNLKLEPSFSSNVVERTPIPTKNH
jgi:hypothetical protein